MSIRPTTQCNRNCNNSHNVSNCFNTHGNAVFQDNAASILYSKRLLANRVASPIYVLNHGVNRTATPNVSDTSFVADHHKCILQYLLAQQHRLVAYDSLNNSSAFDDDEDVNEDVLPQNDRVVTYYSGGGPLSDFITAYYIPRVGPWFPQVSSNATSRLENFFNEFTINTPLNHQEQTISNRLSQIWKIPFTSSVVTKNPSILNSHYTFLRSNGDTYLRQLFLDQYNIVSHAPNSHVLSDIDNIKFTQSGTGANAAPIFDIQADDNLINDVKLAWRTSPYKYFETTAVGGINPRDVSVPITYRSVIPIALNGSGNSGLTGIPAPNGRGCCPSSTRFTGGCHDRCNDRCNDRSNDRCKCKGGFTGCTGLTGYTGPSGGVNLGDLDHLGDLVTTHTAFSLPDFDRSRSSSPASFAWLVSAYTAAEDLSATDPGGKYANAGYTFLITEALSNRNRRKVRYSTDQNQIQINYNHPIIETAFLRQFAKIVASIYHAYTGIAILPDNLIPVRSVCSTSGSCTDTDFVSDFAQREAPMDSVLGLASTLYGQDIFPNPSDNVSC